MNEAERELIGSLEEFVTDLKRDVPIAEKYTSRRVILNLEPQPYTALQVKEIRKLLHSSQVLFAQFMGVSVSAVRGWEQGKRPPSKTACRLMDEVRRCPDYFNKRIQESIEVKS